MWQSNTLKCPVLHKSGCVCSRLDLAIPVRCTSPTHTCRSSPVVLFCRHGVGSELQQGRLNVVDRDESQCAHHDTHLTFLPRPCVCGAEDAQDLHHQGLLRCAAARTANPNNLISGSDVLCSAAMQYQLRWPCCDLKCMAIKADMTLSD